MTANTRSFYLLIAGLGLIFAGTISAAEFTIENRTTETAHVALGFAEITIDPVFGSGSGSNWTEGWFDVEPGQTRVITTKFPVRHYYAATASRKWLGDVTDWVKPRVPFNIKHPVSEAKAKDNGWEVRGFIKLQGKNPNVILREPDTKINVRFSNHALVAVDFALNGNGNLSEFFKVPAGQTVAYNLNVAAGFKPFLRIKQPAGGFQDFSLDLESKQYHFRQQNNRIVNSYD